MLATTLGAVWHTGCCQHSAWVTRPGLAYVWLFAVAGYGGEGHRGAALTLRASLFPAVVPLQCTSLICLANFLKRGTKTMFYEY